MPSANVGTRYNYLNGVAAVSSSDVWAVGYGEDDTEADHVLLSNGMGAYGA